MFFFFGGDRGVYSGASTEVHVRELATQAVSAETSLFVCSPKCKKRMLEAAKQSARSTDRVLVMDIAARGRWTLRSALDGSDLLQDPGIGQSLSWSPLTD